MIRDHNCFSVLVIKKGKEDGTVCGKPARNWDSITLPWFIAAHTHLKGPGQMFKGKKVISRQTVLIINHYCTVYTGQTNLKRTYTILFSSANRRSQDFIHFSHFLDEPQILNIQIHIFS